ncbi:DNA glycosylase AlkZ-like family protein [uncultured Cohaesibacter sp.]|uniref:winged helix-turn-helix domain-containing protein n=1 Tax=uncultured Cohaesibacter sp. TaxID=1002546 RepID=UPI002AA82846|nr:crosslink repair DNA glycosylase YcaQ family protein [uncultured Cohaesibacter sp.]
MSAQSLSKAQARRIALKAQGFLPQRRGLKRVDRRHLDALFQQVSLLQIDSVNVLDRAHYLTLFARFGAYDKTTVDRLLHDVARTKGTKKKDYFEYWGHEASVMPVSLYPALKWRMERARRHQGVWGKLSRYAKENPRVIKTVLQDIADRGPLCVSDLEKRGGRSGAWWGWNDSKIALEFLFWCGHIVAAGRAGFTRYYDLPERIIPSDYLEVPALEEEAAHRQLMALAAKSHGIGTEKCLRDYFRLPTAEARKALNALLEEGIIEPVSVEGWNAQTYLYRDAQLPARATCRALLAPFDSLIWYRDRAEALFDFRYRIEIYVPKEKRQFGYYVLPFLMGDRLVARLDLKANRQESILEVFAAHGEAHIDQDNVAEALAQELTLMAQWMGLDAIRVGERGELTRSLSEAVRKLT